MQFLGQKWVEGEGDDFASYNPATGARVWQGRAASASQIDAAIANAQNALTNWKALSFSERVQIVGNFKTQLEKNQKFLAECISKEVGKPLWESATEVAAMIGKFAISKTAFEDRCKPLENEIRGARSITRFQPHGVVAVFGPFNFPGHLANGHIIPALLAGNVVLFKPSELAPLVAEQTVKLWEHSGLPAGVLQLLQGGRTTGEYLAGHSNLNGLFFTGSSQTGLILSEKFAKHPEKILALEMGGNNPLVVHDVKNSKAAVYATIQSAFLSAGQRCTCARRLIVTNTAGGDAFLNELQKATAAIRVGAYTETPEPFMGPVISEKSAQNLLRIQDTLLKHGAVSLVPAASLKPGTGLLQPGLIDVTEVQNREDAECFGPLLQVIRVKNFEDALVEANRTRYGLAAGLFCDDEALWHRFRDHVRAGVVNWNEQLTGAASSAPFGGIGLSGNHRPSAYFAADYCASPVASLERKTLELPAVVSPGLESLS